MGDANELNDTNYTATITNIFSKLYLSSELRSHQEVNQKNFKATEDKVQLLYQDLNECARDQTVDNLLACKKQNEELKQLNLQLSEQEKVLRDATEKEKQLHEELVCLKNRLADVEKQKAAFDRVNKNVLQENKLQLAALDKAIKVYSANFSMNLDVMAAENDKISYKVTFKEKPACSAVIEIDTDKEQITSFHLHGVSATDGAALRSKFNQHKDPTTFLVDLRNLVLGI